MDRAGNGHFGEWVSGSVTISMARSSLPSFPFTDVQPLVLDSHLQDNFKHRQGSSPRWFQSSGGQQSSRKEKIKQRLKGLNLKKTVVFLKKTVVFMLFLEKSLSFSFAGRSMSDINLLEYLTSGMLLAMGFWFNFRPL